MSDFWDAQRQATEEQIAAATTETRAIMNKLGSYAGGQKFIGGWGVISDGWRRTFAAYLENRTLHMCPHATEPSSVIVNAWDLGWMRCPDCNARATAAGGEDDARCDGCGELFPGEITPIIHQMGPVVFIGGLCPACHQREHDTGGGPS